MKKIIICKGLPASGKSTWSKEYVKENPNVIRVNRDEIRDMLGQKWSRDYENKVVVPGEKRFVRAALDLGYDAIIDDTNLNPSIMAMWKKLGEELGAEVIVKEFNVDPEECIRRDALRDRTVGRDVIMRMYNNYVKGQ